MNKKFFLSDFGAFCKKYGLNDIEKCSYKEEKNCEIAVVTYTNGVCEEINISRTGMGYVIAQILHIR